jgi:uncharacterized protein
VIRLIALACGLLCGVGLAVSGLHDPSALRAFALLQSDWSPDLGIGLLVAVLVAAGVTALAGRRKSPLLGGEMAPLSATNGARPLVGAALFGVGWGLSGYFPLAAMVSMGLFAPGAAIFLISVLVGLMLMRAISAGGLQGAPRGRSRG